MCFASKLCGGANGRCKTGDVSLLVVEISLLGDFCSMHDADFPAVSTLSVLDHQADQILANLLDTDMNMYVTLVEE